MTDTVGNCANCGRPLMADYAVCNCAPPRPVMEGEPVFAQDKDGGHWIRTKDCLARIRTLLAEDERLRQLKTPASRQLNNIVGACFAHAEDEAVMLRTENAHVKQEIEALLAELEKYRLAVFFTAAERAYDEMAVRHAVSLELAELIIRERAALTARESHD